MSTAVPPIPPSQPSLDAKHASVSARQVAVIGAIAGLLSAAIAVPVTYWSAKEARESSVETTLLQLTGETDRSRAEFKRGQQQKLYTSIATRQQALNDLVSKRYEYIQYADAETLIKEHNRSLNGAGISQKYREMNALLSTMAADGFSVDIIGSDGVRKLYPELLRVQELRVATLDSFENDTISLGLKNDVPESPELKQMNVDRQRLEDELRDVMRADMG